MKISVAEVIEKINDIDDICKKLDANYANCEDSLFIGDIIEMLEEYKSFILRLGVNW